MVFDSLHNKTTCHGITLIVIGVLSLIATGFTGVVFSMILGVLAAIAMIVAGILCLIAKSKNSPSLANIYYILVIILLVYEVIAFILYVILLVVVGLSNVQLAPALIFLGLLVVLIFFLYIAYKGAKFLRSGYSEP